MDEKNKAGVRRLVERKAPVFGAETDKALMGLPFPASVGNNGGLRVKIAVDFYAAKGVKSGEVDAITLADDGGEIVAFAATQVAEKRTEERHADNGGRPQVQDSFHEADNAEWEEKKYRGRIQVSDIVAALARDGHTPENKAPEGWLGGLVNGLAAAAQARRAKIAELAAEQDDPNSGPVTCKADARHVGVNGPFQPTTRFVVRFENGEPVERRTHARGGAEMVAGDFFLAPPALDNVYDTLRAMPTPELERAKAEDFTANIKPYCRGCQASATREFVEVQKTSPDVRRPRFLPYGEALALLEAAVRGVSKSRLEAETRRQHGADAFKAEFGAVKPRRQSKMERHGGRAWR